MSTATVTIGASGVNDAPVAVADTATASEAGGIANGIAGVNPTGNVLTNDTDVDAGDTKAVSAVSGVTAGTVGRPTAGRFGSLVLAADGSYTYTVYNSAAAVQALRLATDTLANTFNYTVKDAAVLPSVTTLKITITGANDAPVAVLDTAAATEDVTLMTTALTGVLANDIDVDGGDTKTVSAMDFGSVAGTVGSGVTGLYGTLTLSADALHLPGRQTGCRGPGRGPDRHRGLPLHHQRHGRRHVIDNADVHHQRRERWAGGQR